MAEYISSDVWKDKENSLLPHSSITAVIKVMNFSSLMEKGKFDILLSFYNEIAAEIYTARMRDYNYGLNLLQAEIKVQSDRIFLYSPLYLEKNLPDVSSMAFKIFAELCNLIVSVALKHELVVCGYAGIEEVIKTEITSGNLKRSEKKDSLLHSDLLKVFSFNEIFPEGLDQVFIPAVMIPLFHSNIYLNADRILSDINAVGIYMPADTGNYPAAELAILEELLSETTMNGKKVFVTNGFHWAAKHLDNFSVEEVKERIAELASDSENEFTLYWKKLVRMGK